MHAATNLDATAVNTIRWLSAAQTSIVVPVYQRQYRWDIGGCEQLLADIRAVADSEDRQTHFLGSILSTASADSDAELVLIDGQQRITTLMLLIAALQHTVEADRPGARRRAAERAGARRRPDPHQAAPAARVGAGVRGRRARAPAGRRRTARVPVRRQLRVLPQPDPGARRRRGSGAACSGWSTSRSPWARMRTPSRSSRA